MKFGHQKSGNPLRHGHANDPFARLLVTSGFIEIKTSSRMSPSLKHLGIAALLAACVLALPADASAQSGGEQKPPDQKAAPAADPGKDAAKKIDEFAEAARVLNGPAANPECVWLGRRAVNLLWRDDLDTAFRHLELYDRFACPGGHVQSAFRCVVRQGNIDAKAPESLAARVHACWINPDLQPQSAAQAAPAAATGTKPQ